MPTLHLPAAHTDTDVALAAELAAIVGSHELYVTWTHGEGPGLNPELQALIQEEPAGPAPLPPPAGVGATMAQGTAALWTAFLPPPPTRPALPAPRDPAPPQTTEEWSA